MTKSGNTWNERHSGKLGRNESIGYNRRLRIQRYQPAPVTDADKMISVNGTIRKALNKGGGDEVIVTMYINSDDKLSSKDQLLDCVNDAGMLKGFKALPNDERDEIITTILSQPNESRLEQAIMDVVRKLS